MVCDSRYPGLTLGAVGDVGEAVRQAGDPRYGSVRKFRHRPLLRVVEGVLDGRDEDVGADAIRPVAGASFEFRSRRLFLFARPKDVLSHCDADEIASLFRVVEIADEPPDAQHPDVSGPFTIVKSSLEFHRLKYF